MSISEDVAKISVRVRPDASRNEVVGFTNGAWQIRVSASPVKGRANQELITFLSQLLGISKNQMDISRGRTARDKVIGIRGLSREDIMRQLSYG